MCFILISKFLYRSGYVGLRSRGQPPFGHSSASILCWRKRVERILQANALNPHKNYGGRAFGKSPETEPLTILVTAGPFPFYSLSTTKASVIIGHDPATGLPTVHVESNHDRTRTWLERLYPRTLSILSEMSFILTSVYASWVVSIDLCRNASWAFSDIPPA